MTTKPRTHYLKLLGTSRNGTTGQHGETEHIKKRRPVYGARFAHLYFIHIYTHTYTHMCALYCIYLHPYTQKDPEVDLKAISRNRRYEL